MRWKRWAVVVCTDVGVTNASGDVTPTLVVRPASEFSQTWLFPDRFRSLKRAERHASKWSGALRRGGYTNFYRVEVWGRERAEAATRHQPVRVVA